MTIKLPAIFQCPEPLRDKYRNILSDRYTREYVQEGDETYLKLSSDTYGAVKRRCIFEGGAFCGFAENWEDA